MGRVERNSNGNILASWAFVHENIPTTFATEALAGVKAIKKGLSMGFQKVILEGDSLSIIKKCLDSEIDGSKISAYIRDIKPFRSQFTDIRFFHVHRSSNQVAHLLAQKALQDGETVYLVGSVPHYIHKLVADEWLQEPD